MTDDRGGGGPGPEADEESTAVTEPPLDLEIPVEAAPAPAPAPSKPPAARAVEAAPPVRRPVTPLPEPVDEPTDVSTPIPTGDDPTGVRPPAATSADDEPTGVRTPPELDETTDVREPPRRAPADATRERVMTPPAVARTATADEPTGVRAPLEAEETTDVREPPRRAPASPTSEPTNVTAAPPRAPSADERKRVMPPPAMPATDPRKRVATPPAVPAIDPRKRVATPPAIPAIDPRKRVATPPAVPVTDPRKRVATPPAVPVTDPRKRVATPPAVPAIDPRKRVMTPPAVAATPEPAAPPPPDELAAARARAGRAPTPQPRAATPAPARAATSPPTTTGDDGDPKRYPRAVTPPPDDSGPRPEGAATPPPVAPATDAEQATAPPEPSTELATATAAAAAAAAASSLPPAERPGGPRHPRPATPPPEERSGSGPRLPRPATPPPEERSGSGPRLPRAGTPPPTEVSGEIARARPATESGGERPARERAASEPAVRRDAPAPAAVPTLSTRIAAATPWMIVALPAVFQIVLLVTAIGGRIAYPYDLEWMEGGMLHHAQRIHEGLGIYVPPSIEFIPYLYTPLYPSLLALIGGGVGITYLLGRVISVLALVGIAINAFAQLASSRHQHSALAPALAGTLLGLGLFAAAYPYMEGWYDLVRADTLFLFMVTSGIAGLPRWATTGSGIGGHARVAAGAALLALAFFTKQTGIVYVALGGLIVLVLAWRRVFAYVASAGLIGLGGTWLLQQQTDGWFWIYIRDIHAAHDFNMDRFWKSFENILWHFPAMTIVIGAGLVVVLITRIAKGPLPRATHPLLLWFPTFAVSTLIGAIGWGTEFAHFNAYMPAFLHGGLAAGAAVVAIHACARVWWGERPRREVVAAILGLAAAIPLAYVCYDRRWDPQKYVPTDKDRAAGDRLIARLAAIEGEVWMPSHPWYLKLAGHTPRVHRMGIKDVTWRQPRKVENLEAALAAHAFAAIVLDVRDVHTEVPAVQVYYRPALKLPADERPRLRTGAKVVPDAIWVPAVVARPPQGARALFDFEQPTWDAWTPSGPAWGSRPASESLPGQGLVLGASGRRFATSMHGGDAATGRITSPAFTLDGKIALQLGGGTDATKLRVELWVDDRIVATASAPAPGGDTLRPVVLDPGEHRGATGKLVFVDDSPTGHLDADDVWLVP